MINYIELTNAMVDTFRKIPDLVAAVYGPESIIPYIDVNPDRNQLLAATYEQGPGTIMVAWTETLFAEEEVGCWLHYYEYYLRAKRKASALELISLLVDGTPVPGDGLIWRYCPFLEGLYPTQVISIARVQDAEQIDTYVIKTETKETGDAKHGT